MRPSEQCKQAGLKSLSELQKLSEVPLQTLLDWHKSKPNLFKLLLLGAVTSKANTRAFLA